MNTMIGGLTTGWGGNPQLLRPTGETRMQVARLYNTTCIYYMYILGYLDMEFRMLKEDAISLGIYQREVKKDINIIATEAMELAKIVRQCEVERMKVVMENGLKHWAAEYKADFGDDLLNRLQALAMRECGEDWVKFVALTSNFVNREVKDERMQPLVKHMMTVNGLANCLKTAGKTYEEFARNSLLRGWPSLSGDLKRVQAIIKASERLNARWTLGKDEKSRQYFDQAARQLNKWSFGLIDNTSDKVNREFFDSETNYLKWYAGRAVLEYREKGKLPKEVTEEVRKVMGGHYLLLLKEWKMWSRTDLDGCDAMDVADKMEEQKNTNYTRYTEEMMAVMLMEEN